MRDAPDLSGRIFQNGREEQQYARHVASHEQQPNIGIVGEQTEHFETAGDGKNSPANRPQPKKTRREITVEEEKQNQQNKERGGFKERDPEQPLIGKTLHEPPSEFERTPGTAGQGNLSMKEPEFKLA